VPALAPEERRAALIAATVPLLREHGAAVSTRQIAQAAGVAEGTIFGVFPDKTSLVDAAIVSALDPAPTLASLEWLTNVPDLHTRLGMAVSVLTSRFRDNAAILAMARQRVMTADVSAELRCGVTASRDKIMDALTAVIEPDAERLRRSPRSVARLLVVLVGTTAYGVFDDDRMSGDEIVTLLLDGLLVRPSDTATDGGS